MSNLNSLTILTIVLTSVCVCVSEDDLLDQYVNYVEKNMHFKKEQLTNVRDSVKFVNARQRREIVMDDNDDNEIVNRLVKSRRTRQLLTDVNDNEVINKWTHSEVLDDKGDVVLRWYTMDKDIFFRAEARTHGYVGIGFSPNGDMRGADIALAWFHDEIGQPMIMDCYGGDSKNGMPLRDEIENYVATSGAQNETHTIIEFRRPLDTCDPQDYVLGSDTVRIIWATHDSDPQPGAPLTYHGKLARGTRSVHLLGPTPASKPNARDPDLRRWDVTLNNFVVPDNMDTFYWCKIFKPPTLQEKHHIIGSEPIISANHSGFAHHMLLYECEIGPKASIIEWEGYSKLSGAACYSQFMPKAWDVCLTPVVTWAVGSKGEFLPPHVGLPVGERTNTYYMLEIHFDNPRLERAAGTSGLRVHYTRRLRQHDAGILVTGVTISPLHVIPPRQPEYKTAGLCHMDCTRQVLPETGINIVSVLLHSHLAGKRLSLRHIRNGEELPKIAEDNHYDFDYQQSRTLPRESVVFPGDTLVTECVYGTKTRTRPTVGGYSTKQEMCLAFVTHYPRTQLAGCYSMSPVKQFFKIFGVNEFYDYSMDKVEDMFLSSGSETTMITPRPTPPAPHVPSSFPTDSPGGEMSREANERAIKALQQARGFTVHSSDTNDVTDAGGASGPLGQLVVREPPEFRNKTFMSHLSELPWDEPLLTKRIEESFYHGKHLTFCRKRDDTLVLPARVYQFPNFTKYDDNNTKRQCNSFTMFQNSNSGSTVTITSISLIVGLLLVH